MRSCASCRSAACRRPPWSTSPKAKPSLRQSSRVMSGNSSCSGAGRMTAPDRLCPPQVLRLLDRPRPGPRRGAPSVSGSSASSCSSRLAHARPAVPPPTIATPTSMSSSSASSPRLMNSLGGVDRRRVRRRDRPSVAVRAGHRDQPPFLAFTASVSLGRILFRSPTIAEVGELEDRRVRVLVDRDDVLRVLHADLVLDRAGDARPPGRASARRSCPSGRSAPA